jgi:hypothetical protein
LSLKNLADRGVQRLLNRVKQLVAFDGHIRVWADGLSFANAFSHPHVQLRNVARKSRRDGGWNPAIALRYREIRQRFARLRTARSELGDLYVGRLARVCRRDSQNTLGAANLEQESRPVGGAAPEVDRCDRDLADEESGFSAE